MFLSSQRINGSFKIPSPSLWLEHGLTDKGTKLERRHEAQTVDDGSEVESQKQCQSSRRKAEGAGSDKGGCCVELGRWRY